MDETGSVEPDISTDSAQTSAAAAPEHASSPANALVYTTLHARLAETEEVLATLTRPRDYVGTWYPWVALGHLRLAQAYLYEWYYEWGTGPVAQKTTPARLSAEGGA